MRIGLCKTECRAGPENEEPEYVFHGMTPELDWSVSVFLHLPGDPAANSGKRSDRNESNHCRLAGK